MKNIKISVIGLGKLGFPMALFLRSKFDINAYDSNKDLRNLIKKNPSLHLPKENNIQKYLKKKLNVFETMHETLVGTNICYITVPTPSMNNGKFSNKYLIDVLEKISQFLIKSDNKKKPFIININSTVSPGSFDEMLIPFMKKKGLFINKDFEFIYNPYFVALGDVVKNLENPDFILLGSSSLNASKKIKSLYSKLYRYPVFKNMKLNEAELVKLLVNSYVSSKISFTNFVKDIADNLHSVSTPRVLDAIGTDKRIGNNFLRPGGPFLGPCLPRDIVALNKFCKDLKIKNYYPQLTKKINENTFKKILGLIKILKKNNIKNIGFTGLAYKPNTEFFQESLAFKLMEECKKNKINVLYFDRYINIKFSYYKRVKSVQHLIKKSDVIFISYVDNFMKNKQKLFKKNIKVWDIFSLINLRDVKKFSNKKEFIHLIQN